jgi:cellulose synthase (UDP-forming)
MENKLSKPILGYYLIFFMLSGSMLYFSSLRIDYTVQAYISGFVIFFLLAIRHIKRKGFWRVLFLALSSFIVLRYFLWRSLYTLEYQGLFSFAGSITLFAAEVYGGLMFFFSAFVNIRPLQRRSIPLPDLVELWPSVDVIIPSYNEPVELVKITLTAACNIDYPENKLRIYLLDDGATEQKLNAGNHQTRSMARQRQQYLQELCADLNIHYLSRKDNSSAKAGNMNAALAHISGELILVLDADHAPAVDILKKTVGSFIQDEKIFLVQTPHFFINPDPLEKNLNLFQRMPAENLMFYGAIQLGLDFWQSSFFCGSAAILRRKAIDELGGFKGKTITEDSETALLLHSRGWKSQYLMHP